MRARSGRLNSHADPRRMRAAGFTLVEILVVISLIAILAAIAAGAFAKIRASQDRSNTEATLNKIHTNLDVKWKIILDDARRTVPPSLVTYCGNDRDRALVVWTYAKLKNELPETPEESVNDVVFPTVIDTSLVPPQPLRLKARKSFANVAAACVTSRQGGPLPPNEYEKTDPEKGLSNAEATARQAARESAALLFAALSQTGAGGSVTGQEGTSGQVAVPGPDTKQLSYFKDSWGQPVAFVRHAFAPEIDLGDFGTTAAAPLPPKTAYTKATSFPSLVRPVRTDLDPGGKLIRINPWSGANSTLRNAIVLALNANRPVGPGRPAQMSEGGLALTLDNRNSRPTLVSAGPNRDFGDGFGLVPDAAVGEDGADNILSFRLRREGARGD